MIADAAMKQQGMDGRGPLIPRSAPSSSPEILGTALADAGIAAGK
jgi:hypothetical protein